MNKTFTLLFLMGCIISCTKETAQLTVSSPNGSNSIEFYLSEEGAPHYLVHHNNKIVIDSSSMSFDFKDQNSLKSNLNIHYSCTMLTNQNSMTQFFFVIWVGLESFWVILKVIF